MLLQRPGVLVVEVAEAKALSDELALSNAVDIERKLPFYLTGTYRHEGTGDKATIAFGLELKRGTALIGDSHPAAAVLTDAQSVLRQNTNALLSRTDGAVSAPPEMRAEAAELAAEARAFMRVGDWTEGRTLAEASLLAYPDQPQAHGLAFHCLNELADMTMCRDYVLADPDLASDSLEYFNASIPHLKAYMKGTLLNLPIGESMPVQPSVDIDQFWRRMRMSRAFLTQTPEVSREFDDSRSRFVAALTDVVHYKSKLKIQDNTAELCMLLLGQDIEANYSPPSPGGFFPREVTDMSEEGQKQYKDLLTTLFREFSYRTDTEAFCSGMCGRSVAVLEMAESLPYPKLQAVARQQRLERLAALGQRAKESAAAEKKAKLEKIKEASAAPDPHVRDPEVTFTPLELALTDADPPVPNIAPAILGSIPPDRTPTCSGRNR